MTLFDRSVVFAHRPPNETELAKFRLLLSTFQDGTGMQAVSDGTTLPGWRDFERATALTFGGIPSENKDIMDVRLNDPTREGVFFGISCKMRRELRRAKRIGRVTIELSNAARAFWDRLGDDGITPENYRNHAHQVGSSIVNLVRGWHLRASVESGGDIDLSRSCYLTLMWDASGEYQLFQFRMHLPDPTRLRWYYPEVTRDGVSKLGNHIRGDDDSGTVLEWYGQSGGQLKYYPVVGDALWESHIFNLEPLPQNTPHGLIAKAQTYYAHLWPR